MKVTFFLIQDYLTLIAKRFFLAQISDFGKSYAVFAKKISFSFITLILIICKANIKTDKTIYITHCWKGRLDTIVL